VKYMLMMMCLGRNKGQYDIQTLDAITVQSSKAGESF